MQPADGGALMAKDRTVNQRMRRYRARLAFGKAAFRATQAGVAESDLVLLIEAARRLGAPTDDERTLDLFVFDGAPDVSGRLPS